MNFDFMFIQSTMYDKTVKKRFPNTEKIHLVRTILAGLNFLQNLQLNTKNQQNLKLRLSRKMEPAMVIIGTIFYSSLTT